MSGLASRVVDNEESINVTILLWNDWYRGGQNAVRCVMTDQVISLDEVMLQARTTSKVYYEPEAVRAVLDSSC
jgi:hypothetical protein